MESRKTHAPPPEEGPDGERPVPSERLGPAAADGTTALPSKATLMGVEQRVQDRQAFEVVVVEGLLELLRDLSDGLRVGSEVLPTLRPSIGQALEDLAARDLSHGAFFVYMYASRGVASSFV